MYLARGNWPWGLKREEKPESVAVYRKAFNDRSRTLFTLHPVLSLHGAFLRDKLLISSF